MSREPDYSRALVERIDRTTNPDRCRALTCELLRQLINRVAALEAAEKDRGESRP